MTAENQFNVSRIKQEHNQFWSNPQFAHRIEIIHCTLLQNGPEDVWHRKRAYELKIEKKKQPTPTEIIVGIATRDSFMERARAQSPPIK